MEWIRNMFDARLPRRTRVLHAVLLGLLAAACIYRVWLIIHFNPMSSLWSDPGRHWNLGTRPLDTQPLAAIDPVGYHVYSASLRSSRPALRCWWLTGPYCSHF